MPSGTRRLSVDVHNSGSAAQMTTRPDRSQQEMRHAKALFTDKCATTIQQHRGDHEREAYTRPYNVVTVTIEVASCAMRDVASRQRAIGAVRAKKLCGW